MGATCGVSRCVTNYTSMKNDPYFKFVAVAILAGVILAFASPTPSTAASNQPEQPVAPVASLTE